MVQGTIVGMDIICINWTTFIYQSEYAESPKLEDPYNAIHSA